MRRICISLAVVSLLISTGCGAKTFKHSKNADQVMLNGKLFTLLKIHYMDRGREEFPENIEELVQILTDYEYGSSTVLRRFIAEIDGKTTFVDMWGNEIRYDLTVKDDGLYVRIYSCGANGIDEHGDGDDKLLEKLIED